MIELADAHVHFFEKGFSGRGGIPFPNGQELIFYQGLREAFGIGEVLVVGYGEAPYEGNNRYLSEIARLHHWIHPLAFLPTSALPSRQPLEAYRDEGFKGFSLYITDASKAERFSEWVASEVFRGIPAILSLNIHLEVLPLIHRALEKLEDSKVLLSHLGLPLTSGGSREALKPLTSLAKLPHIGVKASAFYAVGQPEASHAYPHREAHPIFEQLLEAYGGERLYWGSDFSPALGFVSFEQTLRVLDSFNLTHDESRAIYGGNLRRLLKS